MVDSMKHWAELWIVLRTTNISGDLGAAVMNSSGVDARGPYLIQERNLIHSVACI